jgi:outer membrane protein assembly factor BamB
MRNTMSKLRYYLCAHYQKKIINRRVLEFLVQSIYYFSLKLGLRNFNTVMQHRSFFYAHEKLLYFKVLCFFLACFLVTACSGLGDDNTPRPTPLVAYPGDFKPVLQWSTATGGKMGKDFLRLGPLIKNNQVFASSKGGYITAVTLRNGRKLWKAKVKQGLSSAPAVGENVVIVASLQPQLIALKAESGCLLWRQTLPNQVFASPAISRGRVIVKTVDGKVLAFSLRTGQPLWTYDHGAPTLVLRPSSAPQIVNNKVLIGFSDGTLTALNLRNGNFLWERTIVFPEGLSEADQLVDIVADPLLNGHVVYVATFQGKIADLSLQNGEILWERPFSSYSGLALGQNLYATDSEGGIWAFNRANGRVIWRNFLLRNRILTGPAVMNNYLVIGDKEGYLHWFTQSNGQPVARVLVNHSGILATPRVACPLVCVLTKGGNLSAWILTRPG